MSYDSLKRMLPATANGKALGALRLLLVPALVFLSTMETSADTVRLRRSAVLPAEAEAVQLQVVADLTGSIARAAGEISIKSTAMFENSAEFVVTLQDVRDALTRQGVNLGRIAFSGDRCRVYPSAVGVTTAPNPTAESLPVPVDTDPGVWAAEVIAEGTLRGQVAKLIATSMQKRNPATVRLEFGDGDFEKLKLSTVVYDFEIIPQATASSPRLPLAVRVFQGDRFLREFRLIVKVRLQQDVYVAERYLTRGETIRPGDFSIQNRLLDPGSRAASPTTESLHGKEARGRITKGSVLRAGDALAPVTIQRHDEVKLLIKRGAFTISMAGKALESGRIGDVIRVRALAGKNELRARIETTGILVVISK